MRRVFVTNLALVLVLNLLVKPFYILGIDAEVQVRVGTPVYGAYAALLSFSFLLNILLDLGITNWNTRHIAQNPERMRERVGGILVVRALLVILYLAVILVAALVLGYRGWELRLLGMLVVNQVLVSTILYLRSNIAGAQRFAQDSLLSVLDRVLLIAMCGYLLWSEAFAGQAFRIEWFVWAQTAAYGLTMLVAFALVVRRGGVPWPHWDIPLFRQVLRESFPYALLVLLMTFYYRTDSVMLERLLPDGPLQAGIYAQGFRFFEAFNMLGFLLAGLLLPMFSRMLKEGTDISPLTGLAMRLVAAGALAVAVLGSCYAGPIMELRYQEHTQESAPAFAVLIWSFVAVCTTYVYGTLLTANGDLRMLNRMAAGGMVLNIGLNLILIPRFHALGAAWAGLITQSLTAVAQVAIASTKFDLRTAWRPLLGGLLYLLALLAVGAICRHLAFAFWQGAMAIVTTAAVLAPALGLLPVAATLKALGRSVRS